ncbi:MULTISPECIES: hypothetical protein [Nitrosospira]|uniref:hypothetical protein n=1 Tax=Nitrosospira TaxID=35798 RepID=UPI0009458301|nr:MULTISPECIES: hypothetical protein [Nitrosospira]
MTSINRLQNVVEGLYETSKMATKSNSGNSGKIGRDAGTGQFIPVREAQRRPKTTVVETRTPPSPSKKK